MGANGRLKGVELGNVPEGLSLLAVAGYRLSRTLKSLAASLVSRDKNIGLVSWRILMGLSLVDSATQRQLVDFTRMEQAQVSRCLKGLADKGLIGTLPSPTDRRARLFFLTERGRAKHQELFPDVVRLTTAIDAALSHHEQLQFLDMCSRTQRAAAEAVAETQNHRSNPSPTVFAKHPKEVAT